MILSPSLGSRHHLPRLAVGLLFLLGVLGGCQRSHSPQRTASVPEKTPVTSPAFEDEVLKSDQLVVIDFAADWCGPCHMLEPTLHELAAKYEGRVRIETVDVDESQEIAAQYSVDALPTLVFFNQGEEVGRVVGVYSFAELSGLLDGHLADAAEAADAEAAATSSSPDA